MTDESLVSLLKDIVEIKEIVAGLQAGMSLGPRRWLPVPVAAEYAGISERSLRGMFASGRLHPHRPIKGRTLVDRRELDSILESSTGTVRRGRGIRA